MPTYGTKSGGYRDLPLMCDHASRTGYLYEPQVKIYYTMWGIPLLSIGGVLNIKAP